MPASCPRVYWDACIFSSYIEREPECIATLDTIVQDALQTRLRIITSTISITEVAYAEIERATGRLEPTVFDAIDDMWADRSVVTLIEFTPAIALFAREIIRRGVNEQRTLRSADAIHLATAKMYGSSDFHTNDGRLLRWDGEWFPVRPPFTDRPTLPFQVQQPAFRSPFRSAGSPAPTMPSAEFGPAGGRPE
ncbi:MAG: type II toxin-antitoxin system VapC family toxin [Thermomicrobiales bacterium]|nr:type II toxin-antitoxin system VapC family toxin [Thermomicrobiales bacterium]